MLRKIATVLTNDEGATLVEYALVVSLIAIACIGVIGAFGSTLQTAIGTITGNVGNA